MPSQEAVSPSPPAPQKEASEYNQALLALMNHRALALGVQRAVCSADDLLEVLGTALSTQHSAQQSSAGTWSKGCQQRRQDGRGDSTIPSSESFVTGTVPLSPSTVTRATQEPADRR